jgi:hypothetical protein
MNSWFMALTIGAVVLGAVVLFFSIARILALLRESEVARLPVAAQGNVTFNETGRFVLHIEQPRLNMALLHAEFALQEAVTGTPVPSSPVIFRTTTSGFSTASVSVRYFDIAHPGTYRLVITGIDTSSDRSRVALIFTRPYAGSLVFLILCIIFGAACAIGGFVFTALLYTGKLWR